LPAQLLLTKKSKMFPNMLLSALKISVYLQRAHVTVVNLFV
jgi:hypothetical protein